MMPISYIVALLVTLCLIIYYIFGTEEKMWQINCEAIIHGACAFSWFSILFGRSWASLIISGILGCAVGFLTFIFIMSKRKGNMAKMNEVAESAENTEDELIGQQGKIITKSVEDNSYLGMLLPSNKIIVVVFEDDDAVNKGDIFEITKIKGYDIYAKIIKKNGK